MRLFYHISSVYLNYSLNCQQTPSNALAKCDISFIRKQIQFTLTPRKPKSIYRNKDKIFIGKRKTYEWPIEN